MLELKSKKNFIYSLEKKPGVVVMQERKYKCPICTMKKPDSPIIHGLSIMKRYTKHGLKLHIAAHKNYKDRELVEKRKW